MPRFGEHVDADAGQRAAGCDQLLVHPVHPPRERPHAVEVQLRDRGAGQDAGTGGRRDQGAHRRRVQLDVGIQVNPGKGTAQLVPDPDGVRLTGYRRLDHAHVEVLGHLGRPVGARVGDHDDVELAGCRTVEQAREVAGEYRLLVVRRDHDADHRPLAHRYRLSSAARQDSRAGHRTVEGARRP
jgi:hypothetical protein